MHERVEQVRPTTRAQQHVYAGRLVDATPPARSNTTAVAGAALSIVPLVGLILSILGLVRAQILGGAGRTLATIGLLLSLAFTVGEGVAAYELTRPSRDVDPACVAAQSAADAVQARLVQDVTTLTSARSAGDPAVVNAVVADLSAVKSALDRDIARATHSDVRANLQTFDTDLGAMIATMNQLASGQVQAALPQLEVEELNLRADAQGVNDLCGASAEG